MAARKTLKFLPTVFQTDTNSKFLSATMDQLVSEPNLININGYIGRRFAPTFKVKDSYILETTSDRNKYQLEPSIVLRDDQNNITFFASYIDLLNKIKYYGGFTNNHDRLFDNEYYSFDPKISYDKFVNFTQYFWLPNGPQAVDVYSSGVELKKDYDVVRDAATKTYRFTANGKINNTIILARGGQYTFNVDQTSAFWIQTELGVDGVLNATPTISTRDVLGVDNNGALSGVVTFNVPQRDAQERFTSMATVFTVDYAAPVAYSELQNQTVSDFLTAHPEYAGIAGQLAGKYVIFVNQELLTNYGEAAWTAGDVYDDSNNIVSGYGAGNVVPDAQRFGIWQVQFATVAGLSEPIIRLVHVQNIALNEKVFVRYGIDNANKEFYKDYDGFLHQVPVLSSLLDTLYIQDATDPEIYTKIKIVEPAGWNIDVENDILGKSTYTSPNGVEFTSGLKITFDTQVVPASYQNKTYYVENVGNSIRLVDEEWLVTPEAYNNELKVTYPIQRIVLSKATTSVIAVGSSITVGSVSITTATETPAGATYITTLDNTALISVADSVDHAALSSDTVVIEVRQDTVFPEYITIKRDHPDNNAWSRNNRWVHRNVITAAAEYNNTIPEFDQTLRAQRPIVQFESDLQLFNSGRTGKQPIDILDLTTVDAFNEYEGETYTTAFGIDITNGARIIFANDKDPLVQNKIYNISLVYTEETSGVPSGNPQIKLTIADDGEIVQYDTVIVTQGTNKGTQWWYTGTEWVEGQQKTSLQQEPLFDVIDATGASFSTYNQSTFAGTKLFGYKHNAAGTVDSKLGFALSYRNFGTQGDIEFQTYFNTDTFTYIDPTTGLINTANASDGFLQTIQSQFETSASNLWKTVVETSKQYQLLTYTYAGVDNWVRLDINSADENTIPFLKVYQNSTLLSTTEWSFDATTLKLTITKELTTGDKINVLIYSKDVSSLGQYQIPLNLDLNAQNIDVTTLTLGQIRNHLVELSQNTKKLDGNILGPNNLRDIEIKSQGGNILQHSAPAALAPLFLLDEEANFVNAVRLAQREYTKFKNKFLELSTTMVGVQPTDPVASVDLILTEINKIKNNTFPWYYSDMVPYGPLKSVINDPGYTVFDPLVRTYEISNVFSSTTLSNQAVLVYLNGTQLILDKDYTFNTDRPAITFDDSVTLEIDDLITIVEYSNTDGTYIPETPTKLGLYPKYIPEIFEDDTYRTPINVIRGHDGSLTPAFGDYRDSFLLELEKRIYNNIKLADVASYQDIYQVVPGKFRTSDYSLSETNQLLSKSFLSWVGNNKLDYSTNDTFRANDLFTWNYSNFKDRIDGESLPGSWRACYQYFYDTDAPHQRPWEMLGFTVKPTWWEEFYGAAPYTSGNQFLWDDLEAGRILAGFRSSGRDYTVWSYSQSYDKNQYVEYEGQYYIAKSNIAAGSAFNVEEWRQVDLTSIRWISAIDEKYSRPGLSQIIPVDTNGNLRNPAEILTAEFDALYAATAWAVGHQGPTESAWRRSSDFPYAVQLALALAKPGRYFGLLADVSRYSYNYVLGQFLTSTNKHLQQESITFNGDSTSGEVSRTAGYLNWIAEYLINLGNNPSTKLAPMLDKYNINLAYKMGGFSDQKYLQVLAEQSSPNSTNDSIIIPNENYNVHLYKSTPVDRVTYSAVILEKTTNGYVVRGYNLANPYFTIIPSIVSGSRTKIKVLNKEAIIYNEYQPVKIVVPYGYEFKSLQQVVDFLISYERYLKAQGFKFEDLNRDLEEPQNWKLSAKEFLFWAQQGWVAGSILVLSPATNYVNLITEGSIADEMQDSQYGTRVLDQNFKLVKKTNYSVMREPTGFKLTLTNSQVIGLIEIDLVQYEHALVFDNITVFNDIIYKPELGNRQYRLKLIGQKTAEWDGSLYAPGFIYNSGIVQEWMPATDYLKGELVQYKNQYYVALDNVIASETFDFTHWKTADYGKIKKGLLPNLSSIAVKPQSYYDSYGYFNDETNIKYSHGLIGFKPRAYLDDLGLNETTQVEFYKGYIGQKGTANAVDALVDVQFNNLNSNINYYEEWAIRTGEYGALDINPFIEIPLDEKAFGVNPALAKFVSYENRAEADGVNTFANVNLYKSTSRFTGNIASIRDDYSNYDNDIPTAGYVSIDDVDATIFDLADYKNLDSILYSIGSGYTIWTAKDFQRDWNVYRLTETDTHVVEVTNSLDNYITFRTDVYHKLAANDVVMIRNFSLLFDGFYQIYKVIDLTRFMVKYVGTTLEGITTVESDGILFTLDSLRFQYMEDTRQYHPPHGWRAGEKVWIDNDAATTYVQGQPIETESGTWKVYEKQFPWELEQSLIKNSNEYSANIGYGAAVKMTDDSEQLIVVGAPNQTNNVGAVNIFERNNSNAYIETTTITPNGANTYLYGSHIDTAVDGANITIAINAPISSGRAGTANVGVLYTYTRESGTTSTIANISRVANTVTVTTTVDHGYVEGQEVIVTSKANTSIVNGNVTVESVTLNSFTYTQTGADVGNITHPVTDTGVVSIPWTIGQVVVGNVNATGGQFGHGFAFDETGHWLYVGAPYETTPKVYVYGLNRYVTQANGTVTSTGISTVTVPFTPEVANDANALVVTSSTRTYIPGIDYTLSGTTLTFISGNVANGTTLTIKQGPYYTLIDTISGPEGSEFGYAIDSSLDGAQLGVGAPADTVNVATFSNGVTTVERAIPIGTNTASITVDGNVLTRTSYVENSSAGSVYVYDRVIEAQQSKLANLQYETNETIKSIVRVLVDDTEIDPSQYTATAGTNLVEFFAVPVGLGKTVKIETNKFTLLEKLIGIDSLSGSLSAIQQGARFGTSLTICSNNCAFYIGAPYFNSGEVYNTGAVWKFHNRGRLYGTNTGSIKNPTFTPGDTIRLDNFEVVVSGTTLDSLVEDINNAGILGVSAVNENGYLRLDSDRTLAKNLLRILSGSGTVYEDAGLAIFAFMQIIINPFGNAGEYFGNRVILARNAYMLLISSDRGTTRRYTTFDNDTTYFDIRTTGIYDKIRASGSVYTYELYDDPRDAVEHPGRYQYCQQIDPGTLNPNDLFGSSIDIIGGKIIVGAPGDDTTSLNGGSVYVFENPTGGRGWKLIHHQQSTVDIESVNRMFIYNKQTNSILTNLEFIDPAKGKVLGQAEQEITYKTAYDPARYNRGTSTSINLKEIYWGSMQVGQVWWDLEQIRFINYEQDELLYRSLNWGRVFPGSTVEVLEWVESDTLPSDYEISETTGEPKYPDNSAYVETLYVDPVTGIISNKYYFWVKNKTTVSSDLVNRSLPIKTIQNLIENPKNNGTPYAAVISENAVILYNVNDYLVANDSVLHIDYELLKNNSIIHSEYELIQKNNPANTIPEKLVAKLIDSLSGIDLSGLAVPDMNLSLADRYGLSIRPRQSMFIDRIAAVTTMIDYVNALFLQYPISKQYTLTELLAEEDKPSVKIDPPEYDLAIETEGEFEYLDLTNLDAGYKVLVNTNTTVENRWTLHELQSDKSWSLVKTQSYKTKLFWDYIDWYASGYDLTTKATYAVDTLNDAKKINLTSGVIVKVRNSGNGEWQLLLVNDLLEFEVIGIQNGTVKLNLSKLTDTTINSAVELRHILTALKNDIFTGPLIGEFNNLFFTLIDYIFTEQKYVDWAFKTSFISVVHNLRGLVQTPSYIKDNQTYYQDYINEVKPYKTKIREYLINYNSTDNFQGSITDFDLPAYYDTDLRSFRSPSGEQLSKDTATWQTSEYNQWYQNRNHQVESIDVVVTGSGYTEVPVVEIYGTGTGAEAHAVINGDTGEVIRIVVDKPGSGYSQSVTVKINGNGVGARAYARLANPQVRSINTTMKFDRIGFRTTVIPWSANTFFTANTIVSYNGAGYVVNSDITTTSKFIVNDYTIYNPDNFKTSNSSVSMGALDRIASYYSPATAMPQIEVTTVDLTLSNAAISSNTLFLTDITNVQPGMTVGGSGVPSSTISNVVAMLGTTVNRLTITGNTVTATANTTIRQTIQIASATIVGDSSGRTITVSNLNGQFQIGEGRIYVNGSRIDGELTTVNAGNIIISVAETVNNGDTVTQEKEVARARLAATVAGATDLSVRYISGEFIVGRPIIVGPQTITGSQLINAVKAAGYITLSSNVTANAGATLSGTYQNFSQVMSGLDYPGVQVAGLGYNQVPGFSGADSFGLGIFDQVQYDNDGTPLLSDAAVDTIIRSQYTDVDLGTRAEDIDVDGGQFVDTYSSHAPEELIPGIVFDTLNMQVYTILSNATVSNTAVVGYRMFSNMLREESYTRIADAYSTKLARPLLLTDTEIYVEDASKLLTPSPTAAVPGIIFINGERITYYTIDLVDNKLGQLRRGTQGTGAASLHLANTPVVDSSILQVVPGTASNVRVANVGNTFTTTTSMTYELLLSANISTNVGDIITQTTSSANLMVVGQNQDDANLVWVTYNNANDFDYSNVVVALSGNITANIGDTITQSVSGAALTVAANVATDSNVTAVYTTVNTLHIGSGNILINGTDTGVYPRNAGANPTVIASNLAINGSYVANVYPLATELIGKIDSNGNVTVTANTILKTANVWYNVGASTATDGTGFSGATTVPVLFLKGSPANNTVATLVKDMIVTEDAINTLTTETDQIIIEE